MSDNNRVPTAGGGNANNTSSTPHPTGATTNRGGPSGNEGPSRRSRNRSGRNRNNRSNQDSSHLLSNAKTFEGSIDELKGHIYDCVSPKDADRFLKTTTRIQEYISRTLPFGELLAPSLDSPQAGTPTLVVPTANYVDPANPTEVEKMIVQEKVKLHIKKESAVENNNKKLFSIVKGQCTDAMVSRIEGHNTWNGCKGSQDGLALLVIVKEYSYDYQHQQYIPLVLTRGVIRLYTFKQRQEWSVAKYHEAFKNVVDVFEAQGGTIGEIRGLLKFAAKEEGTIAGNYQNLTDAEKTIIRDKARQYQLAVLFIEGADPVRFGSLLIELDNSNTLQLDTYPRTLKDAYNMLLNWKDPKTARTGRNNPGQGHNNNQTTNHYGNPDNRSGGTTPGAAFVNHQEPDGNNETILVQHDNPAPKANNGNAWGNRRPGSQNRGWQQTQEKDTPGQKKTANNNTQHTGTTNVHASDEHRSGGHTINFGFCQVSEPISTDLEHLEKCGTIPSTWILLDSQSTCDIFVNPHILHNIRTVPESLRVHTTAGIATTNQKGDLRGYPYPVWFMPNGIANVLALKNVRQVHRVTYDSHGGNTFIVHKPDGNNRVFSMSP